MEWISMKDRKPEEGQRVIYYFDICGIHIGKYNRIGIPEEEIGVKNAFMDCFSSAAGFLCDDVSHWMPLPDPPKE